MTALLFLEFIFYALVPLLIALTAFILYWSFTEGIEYTNKIFIKYRGIIGLLSIIATVITAFGQIASAISPLNDPKPLFQRWPSHNTLNIAPNQPYATTFLDNDNNIVLQMGIYTPFDFKGAITGYPKGKYKLSDIEGATELVDTIVKEINNILSTQKGLYNVDISILGVEDSQPPKINITYNDHEWGHIAIPYYSTNDLDSLCLKHFIPDVTKLEHGDFATLRAYGLHRKLSKIHHSNLTIYSKTSKKQGPADRCVIFHIKISGLINDKYNELSHFQKAIFNMYKASLAPNNNVFDLYQELYSMTDTNTVTKR